MLKSRFFTSLISAEAQQALFMCLSSNQHHITLGAKGCHVQHIQLAIKRILPSATTVILRNEIKNQFFGPSTAAAVLAYKTHYRITNTSYQHSADAIVGKMTIAHLDDSLMAIGW